VDENQEITLGRAAPTLRVALAAALKRILRDFHRCGRVYTPTRALSGRQKMQSISYDEMLELAGLGKGAANPLGGVCHEIRGAVHVRSSMNHEEGTWVLKENASMEKLWCAGDSNTNEAKLSLRVPDKRVCG